MSDDIDRIFDMISVRCEDGDDLSAEQPPIAVDDSKLRALHNHELDFVSQDEVLFLIAHYQAWWDANVRITADLARDSVGQTGEAIDFGESGDMELGDEHVEEWSPDNEFSYEPGAYLELEYGELLEEFSVFAGSVRSGTDLLRLTARNFGPLSASNGIGALKKMIRAGPIGNRSQPSSLLYWNRGRTKSVCRERHCRSWRQFWCRRVWITFANWGSKSMRERKNLNWFENATFASLAETARAANLSNGIEFLRTCPQPILDRCWAALNDEDWDESAANVLLDYGRTLWDNGDLNGALVLKRLFENGFRKRLEMSKTAMYHLGWCARVDFKQRAANRRLTERTINANVMAAVEECYYQDRRDQESHFKGACVLLLHRSVFRDVEPTGFMAALCALREAFGFYGAVQIEAARETWTFAAPIIEALEPEKDREQVAVAASFVYCLGVGAKSAGDSEMHDKLMCLAERLLVPKGNEYANCLFHLSEMAGKSDGPAAQLRLLKQILDVPEVDDKFLLHGVRTGIGVLRAELEGDASALDLGGGDEFGIPTELAKISKELAAKMMSGDFPSHEDERRHAKALIEWSDFCEKGDNRAGAFWADVLLLSVALSHDGPDGFPMSCEEILARAERNKESGEVSDQLNYELLKRQVEAESKVRPNGPMLGEGMRTGGLAAAFREIRSGKQC